MRYTTPRFNEVANLFGQFAQERPFDVVSGVNIALYASPDFASPVPLTFSGCREISGSRAGGFSTYYWPSSGIATPPTTEIEYLYVMRDTQTPRVHQGKFVLGGHPDESSRSNFEEHVWIDVDGGTAGTDYPTGTPFQPVNNLVDALAIQAQFSLPKAIRLHGTLTGVTQNIDDFTIRGTDPDNDVIQFDPGASTSGVSFDTIGVRGTLSGRISADRCYLGVTAGTVSGLEGILNRVGVAGTLVLAPGGAVRGLEVNARDIGGATVNFSSGDVAFLCAQVAGVWAFSNMTGADILGIAAIGAAVSIGPSNTGGTARLGGVGVLTGVGGGVSILNEFVDATAIATAAENADAVWDEALAGHVTAGSAGRNLLDARRHLTNRRRIVSGVAPWLERVFDDDGSTTLQDAELRDLAGANITDANRPAGTLIAERDPV